MADVASALANFEAELAGGLGQGAAEAQEAAVHVQTQKPVAPKRVTSQRNERKRSILKVGRDQAAPYSANQRLLMARDMQAKRVQEASLAKRATIPVKKPEPAPAAPKPLMVLGLGGIPIMTAPTPDRAVVMPSVASQASTVTNSRPGVQVAQGAKKKPKPFLRMAAGKVWEDRTLADWPENDFRLFCGNLGMEVNGEMLAGVFKDYPSLARVRVVRDPNGRGKGYGFASFLNPYECMEALRKLNGAYCGSRPMQLKRSNQHKRQFSKKKLKEMQLK